VLRSSTSGFKIPSFFTSLTCVFFKVSTIISSKVSFFIFSFTSEISFSSSFISSSFISSSFISSSAEAKYKDEIFLFTNQSGFIV